MQYRNTKTVGVLEEDPAFGIKKIAEPIGLVAAVIPTTNPTSTAIFKALLCLKTRNAILISPHPRAKKCTIAGREDRAGCGGRGRRAGEHHRLDRRARRLELTNEVMHERGYHPCHRRPRHGARGVFLWQTGAGRRRGQHPGHHRRDGGYHAGRQLYHPFQDV
ncbi:MAG: hypothetical protein ACLVB5_05890 [Christensenellales bacterium]